MGTHSRFVNFNLMDQLICALMLREDGPRETIVPYSPLLAYDITLF